MRIIVLSVNHEDPPGTNPNEKARGKSHQGYLCVDKKNKINPLVLYMQYEVAKAQGRRVVNRCWYERKFECQIVAMGVC